MNLKDVISDNLHNCIENGYDLPESARLAIEEMIEYGALPDGVDRTEAIRLCGSEMRKLKLKTKAR